MSVFTRLRHRSGTVNGRANSTVNPPPSASHLSESVYAARCKLILELRADLQRLDSELDVKLDFPRLVVIGDQSSGKSSLVEAVSGISVPRDSGTCTRCPMECIMRSTTSDSWSCNISLQFTEFDGDGGRIARTVAFGNTINNRTSVDLFIRRAQAAILSPHRPHTDFLTKSESELKREVDPQRLQFSKNSVRVEINDPDSPDLDFVDLPGIVHAVEPPSLEEDVINLVESFIKPENTLILIAMPMTSDWQIQAAVRLAKTADPNGDRTIGILTKPDALQSGDIGSRETWRNILANEDPTRKTRHGYYCVRLPNDLERTGNTRDRAQRIEEDFFNSHAPYNEMEDRSRCGVPNFVKNISALLVERIEKYLPALEKEVDRLLSECLEKIAKLPPVLGNVPHTEILLRISAFCQAFKDAVFGRDHRHFVQGNKKRYSRFSQDICLTKPRYTPFNEAQTVGTGPCLNIDDVRRVKEGTITWELPPHVPFDATVQLVEMYTSLWDNPSLECFDDIVTNSVKFEETLLRDYFGQYSELLIFVRELTSQERNRCRDEARIILKKVLQCESRPLFTQNQAFLSSERNKWLKEHAPSWFIEDTIYSRRRYEQNHQELELMADSYAYFQVAHKRIIDYVPLTIEHELNQTFVNNLQPLLFDRVTRESATPGRLEELVREDSALERRRRRLETRRKNLLMIKEKLVAFWSLSNVPPISQSLSSEFPGSNPRPGSSTSTADYHSLD